MIYKNEKRKRIKRIIAPKPTKKERIPRITGRKRYKPTNAQINPVPHTENPKATNAIFTTNFMLIGRLLPCFLFFTILLIISDFFFMPYRWGVLTYVSGYLKGRLKSAEDKFGGNKYARPKNEGKRKIFSTTIWRQDCRNTFVSWTWGKK